jgi:hypothetical protein
VLSGELYYLAEQTTRATRDAADVLSYAPGTEQRLQAMARELHDLARRARDQELELVRLTRSNAALRRRLDRTHTHQTDSDDPNDDLGVSA